MTCQEWFAGLLYNLLLAICPVCYWMQSTAGEEEQPLTRNAYRANDEESGLVRTHTERARQAARVDDGDCLAKAYTGFVVGMLIFAAVAVWTICVYYIVLIIKKRV